MSKAMDKDKPSGDALTKEKDTKADPSRKLDLGLLEEDDEFEEFPVEVCLIQQLGGI